MLLLLACWASRVSTAPVAPPPPPPQPEDPQALIAWIVAEDPLLRHIRRPDPAAPLPAAVSAWLSASLPAWEVEEEQAGTIAVPLLRGARLLELEQRGGQTLPIADLRLLAPLSAPSAVPPEGARSVLDALGGPDADGLLSMSERQVLLGWLDGPAIDVQPLQRFLDDPRYSRLVQSPAGLTLYSRIQIKKEPDQGEQGSKALREASLRALRQVLADTDAEQAAWRKEREALRAELGVQGDPVDQLLTVAQQKLSADAGNDRSVGRALVAQVALRWREGCPDLPCGGLDRGLALQAPGRWGAGDEAALWEVIVGKDLVDHLEVAWGRPSAIYAQDHLIEWLTGRLHPDARLLVFPAPNSASLLSLSRLLGHEGLTDFEGFHRLLRGHLRTKAEALVWRKEPDFGPELERLLRKLK